MENRIAGRSSKKTTGAREDALAGTAAETREDRQGAGLPGKNGVSTGGNTGWEMGLSDSDAAACRAFARVGLSPV